MDPKEVFSQLLDEFPFDNYIESEVLDNSYKNITDTVLANLPIGSKILDFGCGPCDKTTLLKKLGYDCYGFDDLQDDWHKLSNNREVILEFINKQGINFIERENSTELSFQKSSFDMVMLHDVIEHLHDSPRTILNDLVENMSIIDSNFYKTIQAKVITAFIDKFTTEPRSYLELIDILEDHLFKTKRNSKQINLCELKDFKLLNNYSTSVNYNLVWDSIQLEKEDTEDEHFEQLPILIKYCIITKLI